MIIVAHVVFVTCFSNLLEKERGIIVLVHDLPCVVDTHGFDVYVEKLRCLLGSRP